MSDLQKQNAQAMIAELRSVHAKLAENSKMIAAQNAKIHTLMAEVQNLKKMVIMATIQGAK